MKKIVESTLSFVGEAVRRFPWDSRIAYAQFLAQTYYYVGHSTRLLAVAASRFDIEEEKLHRRFLKHTSEERSHHLLALRDLERLDCNLQTLPELPTTAALYQCQYYQIEYRDPTALFGYILALEGLSVTQGRWIHDVVSKAHGEKSCAFVKVHADDDVEHLETAFRFIDELSDKRKELIRSNLELSCQLYSLFLAGIGGAPLARG